MVRLQQATHVEVECMGTKMAVRSFGAEANIRSLAAPVSGAEVSQRYLDYEGSFCPSDQTLQEKIGRLAQKETAKSVKRAKKGKKR